MRSRPFMTAVVLVALALASAAHALDVSQAKGKVVDADGNPIVDAVITFNPVNPPKNVYEARTDKHGTYWLPNLLYRPPGDWEVRIQAEGFWSGSAKVVSRTADRTLVGDPWEGKIHMGGAPLQVRITGLGQATIDFTLSTEREASAQAAAPAAEDPLAIGQTKIQAGDFAGAIDPLQKAVQASPEDIERRQLLAYALWKSDRLQEAEAEAARAAEIAPDKPGPHLILAEVYKAKGDNARAWEAIQKEQAIDPAKVAVLERVAVLASEMGRLDDAIAANEAITRVQPDHADAWVSLGSLYAEKKQTEKSEQAFRKVVELDPQNASQTFYNIGAVLANKSDLSDADNRKAIEAFRKAVELKPDYAAAHRELAYSLLRSGDADGARRELEGYLKLAPQASDAGEVQATVKSLSKKK